MLRDRISIYTFMCIRTYLHMYACIYIRAYLHTSTYTYPRAYFDLVARHSRVLVWRQRSHLEELGYIFAGATVVEPHAGWNLGLWQCIFINSDEARDRIIKT